jgi:hypothetical protein
MALGASDTLTLESLQRQLRELDDILYKRRPLSLDTLVLPSAWANAAPAPSFLGMRVIESPEAKLPRRRHTQKPWMSDQYHRRIQKKWSKRFGFEPAAFLINTSALQLHVELDPFHQRRDVGVKVDRSAIVALLNFT